MATILFDSFCECKPANQPTLEDVLEYIAMAHKQGRVHWSVDGQRPAYKPSGLFTCSPEDARMTISAPDEKNGEVDLYGFWEEKKKKNTTND